MHFKEQRVFLLLEYPRLDHNPAATRRSFQTRYNAPEVPDSKTIWKFFTKFQSTGRGRDELVGNVSPRVSALDYSKFTVTGMGWAPYSPDLIFCDYFLWGSLKVIHCLPEQSH
ncbi:DUF4817 domain-containing protein [Nephila pilipes]|uniref:DUF4817 domain-containing protein n=1 Tax=Nephila pilipes TaxID=299642 RepID=A0A8X6QJX3_NEPPI|nr:DUF4817 domain-containing protein [Nephila pilipes]